MVRKNKDTVSLSDLLTKEAIYDLADERSYERGLRYFEECRVTSLTEHKGEVVATVEGSRDYEVLLWEEDGELGWDCTCPVGEGGDFCKHCVAVGLAWLEERKPGRDKTPESAEPKITLDDVEKYLADLPKDKLVGMIMERVRSDSDWRQDLLLKTARLRPGGLDMRTYRGALDRALTIPDFVSYHEAWGFAQGVMKVIDTVEDLLREGYVTEVIDLTEHALSLWEESVERIDDSDGGMGEIADRLQDIHLRASLAAKPDPEVLARNLFEWEMSTGWDTFFRAAETYAEVLGERGLALYRELAGKEWAKVPALKPGSKQNYSEYSSKRFRITSIMESLARSSGSVEDLIAVKTRDLSNPFHFLQIAEIYRNAKEFDKALEWAEKGMNSFPIEPDSRLRGFLAEEYRRRGRHEDEMRMVWENFIERPSLGTYQYLKEHAEPLKKWSEWREKALTFIRDYIADMQKGKGTHSPYWASSVDHSLLVEIFLWEGAVEVAWSEAQAGGCSSHLWLELAEKRLDSHPEDAVAVWQRHVEATVQKTNNEAYAEATEYIKKINKVMHREGKNEEFRRYLDELRAAFKPKRNFIKLLNTTKWKF